MINGSAAVPEPSEKELFETTFTVALPNMDASSAEVAVTVILPEVSSTPTVRRPEVFTLVELLQLPETVHVNDELEASVFPYTITVKAFEFPFSTLAVAGLMEIEDTASVTLAIEAACVVLSL